MRVSVVSTAICLSIVGLSSAAEVEAAIRRATHIPAQGLGPALQVLAKDHDFQVLYRTEVVGELRTSGAVGELTTNEALTQLLIGTDLTYRYLDEKTVTIVPVAVPYSDGATGVAPAGEQPSSSSVAERTSAAEGGKRSFWQRFRVAQAETTSRKEEQTSERSSENSQKRIELEEVIVIGTNIRGVYPSSSPVAIYTAEDIERTGATTTEQFIAKLPQNLGTRTQFASGSVSGLPNLEAVTSLDLRGLGVGTTLTLVNGRRMGLASSGQAADISMIPATAIERVEVLTDGASAIYGSDAIGGVVNFVLRDDFDGAETRLSYGGVTSGDLRQLNATQTFGGHWVSGHGLISYDYFDASALDRVDRSYTAASGLGTLTPDQVRHSALGSVAQDLGDRLTLNGDFGFSEREVETSLHFVQSTDPLSISGGRSNTRQYFANLGGEYRIADAFTASLVASYSDVNVDGTRFNVSGAGVPLASLSLDTDYSALDVTAMLDGSLFTLPAGAARFSLGGGYLEEEYIGVTPLGLRSARQLGRSTGYVFGEFFAPLIGKEQGIPLVHRLELSLAARYTRHDDASEPRTNTNDFGENTSPKVGLLWEPSRSLGVRGTYGESFRAPSLTEIDPSTTLSALQVGTVAGVPNSTWLIVQLGPSTDLVPETSETLTLGFDYHPAFLPTFRLSSTYFSIEYQDRIAAADPRSGLGARQDPSAFPEAIFQSSSAAQILEYLSAAPILLNQPGVPLNDLNAAAAQLAAISPSLWIIDNRFRNLARSEIDGFDLSLLNTFNLFRGDLTIGAQLTRIFHYDQQNTASSPVMSRVDTLLLPVDLRGRAHATLTWGAFDGTINVNYVDDYKNPFGPVGAQGIGSWTTVDLSANYEFGPDTGSVTQGLRLSLSVQNIFDEDPPFVASNVAGTLNQPIGFDPANANPLGRLVIVGFSKRWGRR